eukprot:6211904-Pleurochrysis_carterae.AAC.6
MSNVMKPFKESSLSIYGPEHRNYLAGIHNDRSRLLEPDIKRHDGPPEHCTQRHRSAKGELDVRRATDRSPLIVACTVTRPQKASCCVYYGKHVYSWAPGRNQASTTHRPPNPKAAAYARHHRVSKVHPTDQISLRNTRTATVASKLLAT